MTHRFQPTSLRGDGAGPSAWSLYAQTYATYKCGAADVPLHQGRTEAEGYMLLSLLVPQTDSSEVHNARQRVPKTPE